MTFFCMDNSESFAAIADLILSQYEKRKTLHAFETWEQNIDLITRKMHEVTDLYETLQKIKNDRRVIQFVLAQLQSQLLQWDCVQKYQNHQDMQSIAYYSAKYEGGIKMKAILHGEVEMKEMFTLLQDSYLLPHLNPLVSAVTGVKTACNSCETQCTAKVWSWHPRILRQDLQVTAKFHDCRGKSENVDAIVVFEFDGDKKICRPDPDTLTFAFHAKSRRIEVFLHLRYQRTMLDSVIFDRNFFVYYFHDAMMNLMLAARKMNMYDPEYCGTQTRLWKHASSHDATYSDYTEKSEFLLLLESIF